MASRKSSPKRHTRGALSLRLPSFHFDKEGEPRKAQAGQPETPPESASSCGSLETEDTPAPAAATRADEDKDKKRERRKSRLAMFTSFLPLLTPSPPTDPDPAHQTHRKPVSNPNDASQYFDGGGGNAPAAPTMQPPPVPPKVLPTPTMLKKVQKTPPGPHAQPVPPSPAPILRGPAPSPFIAQPSPPAGRNSRDRVKSVSPNTPPQPNRLQARRVSPSPAPRGRSTSAQPPKPRGISAEAPRVVSGPAEVRAPLNQSDDGEKRKSKRSFFRGRSRSNSTDLGSKGNGAWIMSPGNQSDYQVTPLLNGDKVPELWSEPGNVLVHLHPKESGLGPSFRVADHVFQPSRLLNEILEAATTSGTPRSGTYLGVNDASNRLLSPARGTAEGHLYLPLGSPLDSERLISARNLFAFLTNQPLVGTKAHPTIFSSLIQVAGLLCQFGFSNYDGSSFGDSVDASFDLFLDQFGTGDVRHSREKTLEALVLAEYMKSWNLYNEAFTHAVGKYESLLELKSPLYNSISVGTRNRLERANLNLCQRQANVDNRLEAFEFPSLFAGVASSTSREELRNIKFKEWKNSFTKMRAFVLGYYKDLFGNWPPKARSKKNHFSQTGLNRQCLKILYSDLCALYDLLVDREAMTTRTIDGVSDDAQEVDPMISALRLILGEFDRSSPPVLPPIPFDVPKLPTMTTIHEKYDALPTKKQAKFDKTLQSNELLLLLIKSRNIDTDSLRIPFLDAFKEFELKEAKNANPHDLADQRMGHWLFLYVVIQSLPMLVVDAPGLNWTEGVEYFLCQAPQGNPPWMEDAGEVRKAWFQTAGGGSVELSADVIMFSAEGIYMRSHCWLAAKAWQSVAGGAALPPPQAIASPLEPPRAVFQDMDPVSSPLGGGPPTPGSGPNSPRLHGRNASPSGIRAGRAYRSGIAIGLEPLPLPPPFADGTPPGSSSGDYRRGSGAGLSGSMYQLGLQGSSPAMDVNSPHELPPPRKPSTQGLSHTPTGSVSGSTFDDILKGMEADKDKPKKRSFF
ncbi:hypothetical protein B0H63DRAFT_53060 [Podospora didyma]|uniref:DUF8004 domain-containing protein n=1 Tax=Podospora didyma TaxID=330526 RepID=A0AAE0P774_9PEZI|nr:hypothetical protein B0H63DRAFT_53060 [Podospora didyma]